MSTPISEDFANIFKNFKKLCEKHFDLTKFFVKSFHSSSKVFRYFLEIFYRIVLYCMYCIVLYCIVFYRAVIL